MWLQMTVSGTCVAYQYGMGACSYMSTVLVLDIIGGTSWHIVNEFKQLGSCSKKRLPTTPCLWATVAKLTVGWALLMLLMECCNCCMLSWHVLRPSPTWLSTASCWPWVMRPACRWLIEQDLIASDQADWDIWSVVLYLAEQSPVSDSQWA